MSSWPSSGNPPNGTIVSKRPGELYVDTASRRAWIAPLANDRHNWQQMQPGELVSFENASVFSDNEAVTQSL